MSNERVTELLRERTRLLKELCAEPLFLKGTWVERYSTCTRKECACHRGERHGPRHYVAIMKAGKQKQYYVRRAQEASVRSAIEQSQRMEAIMLAITEINLELIREGEYDEQ